MIQTSLQRSSVSWISTYALLSLFTSVQGNGYSFRSEPEQYYYAFLTTAQIIPCEAIETRDDGTEHLIDVTIFRNSERVNTDLPPDRVLPLVIERRIAGILIVPVAAEDSGSTYQCIVEMNGERILSSLQSTLFVGEGLPLAPISNPAQIGETLTTVTIDWGEAPVPTNAPLQGYTITVESILNDVTPLEFATRDNETTIQLFNLTPGQQYRVMVFGRNSNGRGPASGALVASTVIPVPPHPPLQVQGILEAFETTSSINVSWMQPEINFDTMTPVDNFVIFYGVAQKGSPLNAYKNVTTPDNSTNVFTISGITTVGNYSVGVAAINSAGKSEVTFMQETLEVSSSKSINTQAAPQIIIAMGVVGTCLLLILTIAILILLIIHVRRKTRQMTADLNQPDGSVKSDSSPTSKRKGLSSSQPSPLHVNNTVELNVHVYEVEPKRAGSLSPDQTDISSRITGNMSTSSFIDNSNKFERV